MKQYVDLTSFPDFYTQEKWDFAVRGEQRAVVVNALRDQFPAQK
jgi:hypothetical protein